MKKLTGIQFCYWRGVILFKPLLAGQTGRREHTHSPPHRALDFTRRLQKHGHAKQMQVTGVCLPWDANLEEDTDLFWGILTASSPCVGTVPTPPPADAVGTGPHTQQQQWKQEAEHTVRWLELQTITEQPTISVVLAGVRKKFLKFRK